MKKRKAYNAKVYNPLDTFLKQLESIDSLKKIADKSNIRFANIVFFQEMQAIEPENILYNSGVDALLEYLKQWDSGVYYETSETPYYGKDDTLYHIGSSIICYNSKLPYIGLEKIILVDK